MNCKRAKSRIALFVGDDLDIASKKELKAHLSACSPCRQYWQEMKSSLRVLHDPAGDVSDSPSDSVWPRVASRLPRRAPRQGHSRFHGWIAASSVVAACCVLVAYGITYQSPNTTHTLNVPGDVFGGFSSGSDDDGLKSRIKFEDDDANSPELRWHRELEKRRSR